MIDWTRHYKPFAETTDEAFAAAGEPRGAYLRILDRLGESTPDQLVAAVAERIDASEITFGEGGEPFVLDPVPRLVEAREWERIEVGLAQRARALDAFCADAYTDRRIFEADELPARLLANSELHEPRMRELGRVGQRRWVDVCGFDLARTADGEMVVLEDNVRTPSGHAYMLAAREVVSDVIGSVQPEPQPPPDVPGLLAEALTAAAPPDLDHAPRAAVVSDGPGWPAFYEHARLARELDVKLVTPGELEVAAGRLWARAEREREPIDVLYRRTDDAALSDGHGNLSTLGELLWEPLAAGSLGVVNAFGAGIADDKLSYAYTEAMVRFYLEEEPAIRSIRTYDLGVPEERERALQRVEDLVVKPRFGLGGERVLIVGEAAEDHEAARRLIAEESDEMIAQERISLSAHPTVTRGGLEPRRVDLRAFAYATADGYRIAAGGLTRYAADAASMIVNSSQGGGAKDTWVVG
jgi:uncharacterized circularly permuted ATP-grasp superfamily protein